VKSLQHVCTLMSIWRYLVLMQTTAAYIPAAGMYWLVIHHGTFLILSHTSTHIALASLEAMQCFPSLILAYA